MAPDTKNTSNDPRSTHRRRRITNRANRPNIPTSSDA
jgi:hypothetical protein